MNNLRQSAKITYTGKGTDILIRKHGKTLRLRFEGSVKVNTAF